MSEALRTYEASLRARELLVSCLTPEQKQDFVGGSGSFVIRGSVGGRYRIYREFVYGEPNGPTFCIVSSVKGLPAPDYMLSVKLLLQHDEDLFLAIANGGRYRRPWWKRWWAKIKRRR